MWIASAVLAALWASLGVVAQENAGSSVANSLIECYNSTEFLNKDQRLPSTINVLIDLIRKVEDGPTALDAREVSRQLIQRFRQDGIIRSERAANSPYSLPYSPRGNQSWKNRILLQSLVPGNALTFPNDTLSALERCSLHYMLSNSIDYSVRNDESTVCSRLSRYQRRYRRGTDNDIEIFDPKAGPSKGYLEEEPSGEAPPTNDDDIPAETPIDDIPAEDDVEVLSRASDVLRSHSECPVENGVVYTRWGAIQAGTVIAGIASGYEPQSISTSINGSFVVDSRYAVTLAGDLSEAALIQGSAENTISIGASGGWNSTTVPRWYFVQQKEDLEMTDAEIRAGLDGLILGLGVDGWKSSASSMKVSQILDMYYSPRGVFNASIRACNRKTLQTTVAPSDTLNVQTIAFNDLLDDIAILDGTLGAETRAVVGGKAVDAFLNYLPGNLNDLGCTVTEDSVLRAGTELIIVLDTTWNYNVIQPALAYLLDNLDINKYGSNYTLVTGKDVSVIINSSRTVIDFHTSYNLSVHQQFAPGFDYIRIFNDIQQIVADKIDNETTPSGRSLLVLLVPFSTTINEDEVTFIRERKESFRSYVPDVRTLVLGYGSKDNYGEAVFDAAYDVFTLTSSSDSSTIVSAINPVVARIKQIPRRVVNPSCKSNWIGSTSSNSLDQYVEPGSINYYRIAPNYFYSDTGERYLKVRGSGYGPLVVCSSTSVTLPAINDTSSDVSCTSIESDEASFWLNDQCNGHSLISSCPPFYFSVAAANNSYSTSYRCTDSGCRFPDMLKYTISTVNFGCASGAARYFISFSVLIFLSFVYIF